MRQKTKSSNKKNVYACIIAGGVGERFWPKSRNFFPKQFQSILSETSLFQQTVNRLSDSIPLENIFVVTRKEWKPLILKQVPSFLQDNIITEPRGRNTLPAVMLCAFHIKKRTNDQDATMIVLPSDHLIKDNKKFAQVINNAVYAAQQQKIVLVGIKPRYEATGYGYIQFDETKRLKNKRIYKVNKFIEKPPLAKAKKMYVDTRYFWNSGIFCWKVDTLLQELECYQPKMMNLFSVHKRSKTMLYEKLPSLSIDYGLLELTKNCVVVPGDFYWEDLGAWSSVYKVLSDEKRDTALSNFESIDSTNCLVLSDENHLIAGIDIHDLVVVHTKEATLICKKDRAQDVRELVKLLKKGKNKKYL